MSNTICKTCGHEENEHYMPDRVCCVAMCTCGIVGEPEF